MPELRKLVGSRIRELRRARGLTQESLGERAGLSYKFIGEVERGMANPTLDTLASIAMALDVDVPELVSVATKRPAAFGTFSTADFAVVREARDAIDSVLDRFASSRGNKKR